MADQNLDINIRTRADLTGITQTEAELAKLEARRLSLQAQFPGLPGGVLPEEEIAAPIEKAVLAEQELAAGASLAGVNLGKARQEALVLARELATGGNVARTLGSLLGALGPSLTVAGVGALVVYEQIKQMREEAEKMVAETAKLGEEFEKSAVAAQGLVTGARDSGDVSRVVRSVLPELEKLHAEADKLNRETITGVQKALEDLREGIIQTSPVVTEAMRQWAHPYTIALREAQKQAQDNADFADHEAKRRIERAQDFKRQFEGLEKEPAEDAIKNLNDHIKEQETLQKNLNKEGADYVRSWLAAQEIIDRAKKDLADILKYQEQIRKSPTATPFQKELATPIAPVDRLRQQLGEFSKLGERMDLTPAEQAATREGFVRSQTALRDAQIKAVEDQRAAEAEALRKRYAGEGIPGEAKPRETTSSFNADVLTALHAILDQFK